MMPIRLDVNNTVAISIKEVLSYATSHNGDHERSAETGARLAGRVGRLSPLSRTFKTPPSLFVHRNKPNTTRVVA